MALDSAEFAAAMAVYLAANDHTIALRRGTASALPGGLLLGEQYYATDTERLHIGHGDGTNVQIPNAADLALKMNLAGGSGNPFTAMPYVGTAPIVASGSNANGAYIKYADGTMICAHTLSLGSLAVTTASGSMFISAEKTWTFPETFYAAPVTGGTLIGTGLRAFVGATGVSTTLFNFLVINPASITVATSAYLQAIGRWKA